MPVRENRRAINGLVTVPANGNNGLVTVAKRFGNGCAKSCHVKSSSRHGEAKVTSRHVEGTTQGTFHDGHAAYAAGAFALVVNPLKDNGNGASNEGQRQLQQQPPPREVILAMSRPDLGELWGILHKNRKSKAPDRMSRADLIVMILPKCGFSHMTQQEKEQVVREDAEREAAHRESVVRDARRGRGGKMEACVGL